MSWCYRNLIRPFLFVQNPESVHHRTLRGLAFASHCPGGCDALSLLFGAPKLPIKLFDLDFPNPIGLAAGMDKSAEALPAWAAMGFGFTELGAATWLAQPGNPSPRVFRAIPERAIINRMGFNNPGAQALAETLRRWRSSGNWPQHPVGMNLGKSKVTPLHNAPQDYSQSLRVLHPHVDFFVVNVSSPNTPNLRQLQDKAALSDILSALQEAQPAVPQPGKPGALGSSPKPVLVKVSPDLSWEALDEILELAEPRAIAGIIATNTTITRPQPSRAAAQKIYAETGGLSGRPLTQRSTEVIRHIYRQTGGKLPIVGVGGIFNAEDAWDKITAGASLLQIYTGLVYEGPGLPKAIVKGLAKKLKAAGFTSLRQAVGTSATPT